MNAYEKLNQYIEENYGDHFIMYAEEIDEDGDDVANFDYNDVLRALVEEYGKEQRKEGYKKGFEDGENADG